MKKCKFLSILLLSAIVWFVWPMETFAGEKVSEINDYESGKTVTRVTFSDLVETKTQTLRYSLAGSLFNDTQVQELPINYLAANSTVNIEVTDNYDGYMYAEIHALRSIDNIYEPDNDWSMLCITPKNELYQGELSYLGGNAGYKVRFLMLDDSERQLRKGDNVSFTVGENLRQEDLPQNQMDLGIRSYANFTKDKIYILNLTFYDKDELNIGGATHWFTMADNPTTEAKEPVGQNLQSQTAAPTSSGVLVNGEEVAFDAYHIGGNNFFKLRDLAFALSGSSKQFQVAWDGASNAILLTSDVPYTPVGGEMKGKGAGNKTAAPTTSKILLNGKEVKLTAYNIEGNNYFKLRDIGEAFDFEVDWDGGSNRIIIDTSKGYTLD